MKKRIEQNEMYHLSDWFRKIDNDTIELRERRGGSMKLIFLLIMLLVLLFNPTLVEVVASKLKFTFVADTRFEDAWNSSKDFDNPGYTRTGKTKEEFMAGMWRLHKTSVWDGLIALAPAVLFMLFCLRPSKRRFRFDRKRGIIYTYAKGKLHVTEINKLMRPLSEYIVLRNYGVLIWVNPYTLPKGIKRLFGAPSLMEFSVFSMWICAIFRIFNDSTTFLMQRTLIDFMNPDTDTDYLAEMMNAIEQKPSLMIRLFSWWSIGLYCKKLPKQAIIENDLADYFKHIAPTVEAYPSWFYQYKSFAQVMDEGLYEIVSVKDNKRLGFKEVPCPTLFEIPENSLHKHSPGSLEPYIPSRYK